MGDLDEIIANFNRPKPDAAPAQPPATTGPTPDQVRAAITAAEAEYRVQVYEGIHGQGGLGGSLRPPWRMLTASARATFTAPFLEKIVGEAAKPTTPEPTPSAKEPDDDEAILAASKANSAKLKKQIAELQRKMGEVAGADRREKINAELARRGLEPNDPKRASIASKLFKKGLL